MQNFQGTFEAPKRSFIGAFSICMTVPLIPMLKHNHTNDINNDNFS